MERVECPLFRRVLAIGFCCAAAEFMNGWLILLAANAIACGSSAQTWENARRPVDEPFNAIHSTNLEPIALASGLSRKNVQKAGPAASAVGSQEVRYKLSNRQGVRNVSNVNPYAASITSHPIQGWSALGTAIEPSARW